MDNSLVRDFPPRTLDKVDRLLDLLDEMGEHPRLRGKLALHGGTAINLFMLGVPRLSVDIDVSYVGALSREEMLADRPVVERSIEEVARSQGYALSGGAGGHAGRTFVLGYRSGWGSDHVKIDCIYMNRSPILPLSQRESPLRSDFDALSFSDAELVGGKVKAFFDRVKVRDLYDLSNLSKLVEGLSADESELTHKVILYYASLSAAFPHGFDHRPSRFLGREDELEEQLYPMLRKRENMPTLEVLLQDAGAFIERYVLPQNDAEYEYLDWFAQGKYHPELLFSNPEMVEAASVSPEAQWKLANLRKMQLFA